MRRLHTGSHRARRQSFHSQSVGARGWAMSGLLVSGQGLNMPEARQSVRSRTLLEVLEPVPATLVM